VLRAYSREYYIKGVGTSSVAEIDGPDLETAAGYYTGHGEKPGRWLCAGADELGLGGVVKPEQFLRLFDGLNPHTGKPLRTDRGEEARTKLRPGWDCTFSAVKSVSALWALAPEAVAAKIEAAHQAAVDAGLAYLEERAARVRRGKGGRFQHEAKMVAAGFSHRTSRAVDPQLHEHIVIFAQARGRDGRWTTLGSTELYDHFRTADSFYQATLREELTRRLGVVWTPPDENGLSEIVGVDPKLLKLFSKRRAMIEAEIAERGFDISNAAHCQAATLATREGKEGGKSTHELRTDWMSEVAAAGFTGKCGLQYAAPRAG
jgi:conjugative relaxase-like TrwC/TraI family protein